MDDGMRPDSVTNYLSLHNIHYAQLFIEPMFLYVQRPLTSLCGSRYQKKASLPGS